MPAHSRIVVGFDGSADAWAAARYAVAEAAASGGTVRLVHAVLDRAAYAAMVLPDPVADAETEAGRLLDAARDELLHEQPDVEVETLIVARPAGSALVRASRSAEVLVLGRHGHGRAPAGMAFQRVHAGAVTAHVMTYAACPVVVAGPDAGDPGGRPVVLGLNADAPSPTAISYAFRAAQRRGTTLRVCYIRTAAGGAGFPGAAGQGWMDDPRDDADARLLLSRALAGWRAGFPDVPVAVDVLPGVDPAARLLDAAVQAALVVVGSREHSGAPRTGPAAVPDALVRNAVCPVAVVRPQPEAESHRITLPEPLVVQDLGHLRRGRRALGLVPAPNEDRDVDLTGPYRPREGM